METVMDNIVEGLFSVFVTLGKFTSLKNILNIYNYDYTE